MDGPPGNTHDAEVGAEALLTAYWSGLAPEDLDARSHAEQVTAVEAHLALAERRAPAATLVHVRAGEPVTVLVVTPDVPYLVDSLTAVVVGRGAELQLITHPQLRVRRDERGRLLSVGSGEPEAWIRLELDGDCDPVVLEQDVRAVLADVQRVARDVPRMREGLRSAAQHRGEDEDEQEVAALLRWLADGNLVPLGQVALEPGPDGVLVEVAGSTLGLLRTHPDLLEQLRSPLAGGLQMSKAGQRSPVHRPAYLDVVGAPLGVSGVLRTVGLLASSAYSEATRRTPVVRRKVAQALQLSGFSPDSHDGRDLLAVLETFPRDELFQIGVEDLTRIATSVLRLRERRQLRLFLRGDDERRVLSALIYLPRDRYTTRVRLALGRVLRDELGAQSVDSTVRVSESILARLHFVVRVQAPAVLPEVPEAELEAKLAAAARSWTDELDEAAHASLQAAEASRLLRLYGEAFPEAYKEDFPATTGLLDLQRLDELPADGTLTTATYAPLGDDEAGLRLKAYSAAPLVLTEVLPVLQSLGVDVLDERPYGLRRAGGSQCWIYDFGLRYPTGTEHRDAHDLLLEQALVAAWDGRSEVDALNALVTRARLPWRSVLVLRAYATYLRQTWTTYSLQYVQDVLVANGDFAVLLVALFETRLDPARAGTGDSTGEQLQAAAEQMLEQVPSLDADRILRAMLHLVLATVRTNHWQDRPHLSLKLDPQQVPHLPLPRPAHEVWVYSPRFEGVHLRFGEVARGGLRWSDRREDFRAEVFGLVRAQTVKNAVIVPTGAKGGFVGKQLPDPADDRAAWLEQGRECYRGFVRGLLDVTDNLVDGRLEPPPDVLRRDGDDSYLVVAADKGTATFSDTANAVAAEYGFWLDDAFASGGSAGYDHKAMGITARGAWESVRRHFAELGLDVDHDAVTVVGVGDMSGDVFGNGMLLSRSLRLVAAFDHRHVFLDPDPDPAVSWAERRRLFALPRSSWAGYDRALLSTGGGVWPRSAKSVPISQQVRARLALPSDVLAMTPAELVRAVLQAPADLLWNGGIGTYVKASGETAEQVGDRTNDAVRIDGDELRVRVVGEGGNLGLTQAGRVQYALAGGRVNTDAVDNSAGVDTSDHEVNFKIALQQAAVDRAERDALLADLTGEVARRVLSNNTGQNLALSLARAEAPNMRQVHARFVARLEGDGVLDRAREHLPSEAALEARETGGLSSPELSVLLGYSKIQLRAELLSSTLPEDAWSGRALRAYFPPELLARLPDVEAHPLRRQIVSTVVVNDVVERGGITFVFRAVEETGANPADVVRAYAVAQEVFALPALWSAAQRVAPPAQGAVLLEAKRLLDRAVRWLLHGRRSTLDVDGEVIRLGPAVAGLVPALPELLVEVEADAWQARVQHFLGVGAFPELARTAAGLLDAFALLDVVELAARNERKPADVARLYFALSGRFQGAQLLGAIARLPRRDRWQAMARSALRDDLYAALASLTDEVLRDGALSVSVSPDEAIDRWAGEDADAVAKARAVIAEVVDMTDPDTARSAVSVALRSLRALVARPA